MIICTKFDYKVKDIKQLTMRKYIFILFVSVLIVTVAFTSADKITITDAELIEVVKNTSALKKVNDKPVFMMPQVSMLCVSPTAVQDSAANFPHNNNYINVYVNDTAFIPMTSSKKPKFKTGSVLIKEKLTALDTSFSAPTLFTIMIKREKGYNPACGDWEFATVETKSWHVNRGKIEKCMSCHKNYTQKDFIYRENYLSDKYKMGMR